ncbi:ABC transporter ATP-binding protein [Brenneria tiliae]|uniref:ABC transporter ATP-binding protein n=1 Tax=Brenneria tiliae TaxID=2914984 RepID=UPI002014C469|nr:ABC transporter ATP-binding protein [Brenneria tiliae]MCL2898440.1 ABC transporter ATP-binding protein [Brenneria tiliae]MCL2903018.1 ABC transporter ATP-binding protein [Brenneria tiliae]
MSTDPILSISDLHVVFDTFNGQVQAVRGVSFDLRRGETLAIVGESGSGKSVTCRSVIRLLGNNARITRGAVEFAGRDLTRLSARELRAIRGNDIAMIFQDPMTSLNPTMTIGRQIVEAVTQHRRVSAREARERAIGLLDRVGIPDGRKRFAHYPHQFSGGQRQRIVIAIALACRPKILIADEPTTALDVTIQAQILDLLRDIQQRSDTSIIFITHDLGVVAKVADRIAVMYAGRIVEIGTALEIFYDPRHPYTWGLLQSIPDRNAPDAGLYAIPGSPPDLTDPPPGDSFLPRNAYGLEIDRHLAPPLFQLSPTHFAATWLLDARAPRVEPPPAIQKRRAIFEQLRAQGATPGEERQ